MVTIATLYTWKVPREQERDVLFDTMLYVNSILVKQGGLGEGTINVSYNSELQLPSETYFQVSLVNLESGHT